MAAKRLNVAVIGVGNMGEDHVEVFSELPSCNLRAVVDVDLDRAQEIATEYGAGRAETDFEVVLREEPIDAIAIATPEDHHFAPTKAALERDVHVLLEKPITDDVEEAKRIGKLVEASDAELTIGYMRRFIPKYAAIKERIDDGNLGEILGIQAACIGQINSYWRAASWSDPISYVGIHDIDIIRWYVDEEVERVHAEASHGLGNKDTPAIVHTTLKFEDGTVGVMETSWARNMNYPCISTEEVRVTGTEGYARFVLDNDDAQLSTESNFEYLGENKFGGTLHGKRHDPYTWEVEHFIDCIQNGESPLVTWKDGLKTLEIENAILESIDVGEPVYLNESRSVERT